MDDALRRVVGRIVRLLGERRRVLTLVVLAVLNDRRGAGRCKGPILRCEAAWGVKTLRRRIAVIWRTRRCARWYGEQSCSLCIDPQSHLLINILDNIRVVVRLSGCRILMLGRGGA